MPKFKSLADFAVLVYTLWYYGLPLPFMLVNGHDTVGMPAERAFLKQLGCVFLDRDSLTHDDRVTQYSVNKQPQATGPLEVNKAHTLIKQILAAHNFVVVFKGTSRLRTSEEDPLQVSDSIDGEQPEVIPMTICYERLLDIENLIDVLLRERRTVPQRLRDWTAHADLGKVHVYINGGQPEDPYTLTEILASVLSETTESSVSLAALTKTCVARYTQVAKQTTLTKEPSALAVERSLAGLGLSLTTRKVEGKDGKKRTLKELHLQEQRSDRMLAKLLIYSRGAMLPDL